jgi:hypothetical protein
MHTKSRLLSDVLTKITKKITCSCTTTRSSGRSSAEAKKKSTILLRTKPGPAGTPESGIIVGSQKAVLMKRTPLYFEVERAGASMPSEKNCPKIKMLPPQLGCLIFTF